MNKFYKGLKGKEKYIGENDLYLEIYESNDKSKSNLKRPPLLFLAGAWCGSWMWYKYIPHFINEGWDCYLANLRSHYKSRSLDLTRVSFSDYVEDLDITLNECEYPPIVIGHSMGALIAQKLAEKRQLTGLISVDGSECKEVNDIIPCLEEITSIPDLVSPPRFTPDNYLDREEEDIKILEDYFSIESGRAFREFTTWDGTPGMSVNSSLISCPMLVIKAVNSMQDEKIGLATKELFNADYIAFENITHSGLIIGKRYMEVVQGILQWIDRL
jgi:pimeloyl-ACP methyl ester carboxylesterase